MKRINLYIDETTLYHLKNEPHTISETIRIALYEYFKNQVSASQSKKKEGD